MSHTLARLRDALGDPLLVRAGRRLVPTPRALALREPVSLLVAQAQELVHGGAERDLTPLPRDFVVRAPDGMAIVFGAALLAALHAASRWPRCVSWPKATATPRRCAKAASTSTSAPCTTRGPEIRTALLLQQPVAAAVRAGHPLLGARVTLKRFLAQAHVAIAQRGGAAGAVDAALTAAGVSRRVVLTVPSAYGALMAAAQSDLVACAPQPVAASAAASLGLALFPLPFDVPAEQVVQAWHPRLDAEPSHRWLRECVAQLSPEPPAWPPRRATR